MGNVNDERERAAERLRRAKERYRTAALAFLMGHADAVRLIDQAQEELDAALAEQQQAA